MKLYVKKLIDAAKIPERGSVGAAGYDLCSIEEYTLAPMEYKLFKTGLSIAIPPGNYGRIAPRSGLAYKNGIDVLAGVIDEDYRGEVGVILINFGKIEKVVSAGDKIAQIIIETYHRPGWEVVDDLNQTQRATGGFGSTDRIVSGPVNFNEAPSDMAERYSKLNYINTPTKTYEQRIREAQQTDK